MNWRQKLVLVATLLLGACRSMPARDQRSFFFIQMSDPQFGFFTANADFARETVNFEKAIAAANRLRPAFVVVSGDLTHRQGDVAQIAEYHRIAAQLDRSIPLYGVPGNHDLALPLSPASIAAYRQAFGPDYFTFDNHGVHGIVINSSLIKEAALAPAEAEAQENWIRSAVAAAGRSRRVGTHVMIFQHHPWFLARADEPDQYFNLPLAKRREFLDLFARNGVSHVFAGHYHRNAFGKDADLEMVTTGPVGKPLGADSSGFRIVIVDGPRVTHRYYALDSLPQRVSIAP
jgi:3',5'-cyclic AMP phosphodiesterase CpdA